MRSILIVLMALAASWPDVAQAQAQDESLYLEGKAEWELHAWPSAYRPLREYRMLDYGKRPDVDYMLATSGCRIDSLRIWGANMLRAMLYAYPLTVESRKVVRGELELCRGNTANGADTTTLALIDWPPAGMNAVFKTFYWSDDTQPVASYPMRRVETFERSHFTDRLVKVGEADDALEMARKLSPNGKALVSGRLVLVSESGHSTSELKTIATGFNRYIAFLQSEYGVSDLDSYVTIYLVRSPFDVQQRARELHGLDVSAATLGYAYADDLSLIAFVPGSAAGTVLHELFHLMVRANYGDIPQWLDEGVASLYEVSVTDGTRYWGTDNWRGEVLRILWDRYRPTVEELVRSDWYLFDDPKQAEAVEAAKDNPDELIFRENESARQAAMMAMARYFVLYLQEQGQLRQVFDAMRSNDPILIEDREVDPRENALAVVQASLGGKSFDEIDEEFSRWFLDGRAADAGRPAVPVTPNEKEEPGRTYRASTTVNIRRGPGTDFDRIGSLDAGAAVSVMSLRNGWAEIRLTNGASGYVSEEFLTAVP